MSETYEAHFSPLRHSLFLSCHPRENGDPGFYLASWIPAFAGMTEELLHHALKLFKLILILFRLTHMRFRGNDDRDAVSLLTKLS